MSKIKHKWVKRDREWIEKNPGKKTMYKIDENGNEIDSESSDVKIEVKESVIIPTILSKEPEIVKKKPVLGVDSGIYAITCELEKCAYIGQSVNVGTRLRSHRMVMISDGPTDVLTYVKMKDHVKKHGIESFKFEKIRQVSGEVEDLLEAEGRAMLEYIHAGYELYNISVPKNVFSNMVYCPVECRERVLALIKELTDHND